MEEYIEKAAVLIEALPYIQSFRNKTVVIKFGGSAMVLDEYLECVLRDVVFLECVGVNPVLVHGGGDAISTRMRELGLTTRFAQGLRVTDADAIRVVEDVLVNSVNKKLVDTIKKFGGDAKGMSGKDDQLILSRKHPPVRFVQANGSIEEIDIGFVGEIQKIRKELIVETIKQEKVAVVAPIGVDKNGTVYNVNADLVAGKIAAELKAEKLVFLSDVHGIMTDRDDSETFVSSLKIEDVYRLIDNGIISEGMLPKIWACIGAVEAGVNKTHIIDGRIRHSLLLEIFTDKGVGTEIVP